MKYWFGLLLISTVFLSSCFNCRWIKTGYHYDWDGEYVEEGYYDCPEENPVSYDIEIKKVPNLTMSMKTKYMQRSNSTIITPTITLTNIGNDIAQNISLDIQVKCPNVSGMVSGKTFNFNKEIDKIGINEKYESNLSVKLDILYVGFSLLDVIITTTYYDSNGKRYSINRYYNV